MLAQFVRRSSGWYGIGLRAIGLCAIALCALGCRDGAARGGATSSRSATATASARSGAPTTVPANPRTPRAASSARPSGADELEDFDDTVGDDDGAEPGAEQAVDGSASCAPADPKLKPMQVLKFVFTDGIDGRSPRQKLHIARPGQRVYAHLTLRNRSGRERCVRFVFRVKGKKRTELVHKIGKSWSWRTWAYNTVHGDDGQGQLQVVVTDDQGAILLDKRLPVVPGPPPGH